MMPSMDDFGGDIKPLATQIGKILGVHFRGTSYKRSPGHPFPSTKKQMVQIIDFYLKKKKFNKI